jgi:hypothetical protein
VDDGVSSPGNRTVEQLAHFHFHEFEQLGVVNHVALFRTHDVWHANLTERNSRVWGMGRQRRNTQMAPSIWAAPVIMFSHSQRGLGSPRGRSDLAVSYSTWAVLMMPRAFLPVPHQFGRSLWLRRRTAARR